MTWYSTLNFDTNKIYYYFNSIYNSKTNRNLPEEQFQDYLDKKLGSWNVFYTYTDPIELNIHGIDPIFENAKYIFVNFCKCVSVLESNKLIYPRKEDGDPYTWGWITNFNNFVIEYLKDKKTFGFNTTDTYSSSINPFVKKYFSGVEFVEFVTELADGVNASNAPIEIVYDFKIDSNYIPKLDSLFDGYDTIDNVDDPVQNDYYSWVHVKNYSDTILRVKLPNTFYPVYNHISANNTLEYKFINDGYLIRVGISAPPPPPPVKEVILNNNLFFFPNFPKYSDKLPKADKIDSFKLYKDLFMSFENPYTLKEHVPYSNLLTPNHVVNGYYNEKLPKYISERTNRNIKKDKWKNIEVENSLYQLNNYFYPNNKLNYKYKTFDEYLVSAPFFDKEIYDSLVNKNYDSSGFFTETNDFYCNYIDELNKDGFYEIVKNAYNPGQPQFFHRNRSAINYVLDRLYSNTSWPILVWYDENFMPPQYYPDKEKYEDFVFKYDDYFDNFKDVYLTNAIPYHFVNLFNTSGDINVPRNEEPSYKNTQPDPEPDVKLKHVLNKYPVIFNYTNNPINITNIQIKNVSGIDINDIVSNSVLLDYDDYLTTEEIEKYSSEYEIIPYKDPGDNFKPYVGKYYVEYLIPVNNNYKDFNSNSNSILNSFFSNNNNKIDNYLDDCTSFYLEKTTDISFYSEFLYQYQGNKSNLSLTYIDPLFQYNKFILYSKDFINNRLRGSIFNILLKKELFRYCFDVYEFVNEPSNDPIPKTKRPKNTTYYKKSYTISEFYNTPFCRNIKYNYNTYEPEIILEPRHGLYLTTSSAQNFNDYDDALLPFPSLQIYFDLIVPYKKTMRTGFEKSYSDINNPETIEFDDIKDNYTYIDDDNTEYKD